MQPIFIQSLNRIKGVWVSGLHLKVGFGSSVLYNYDGEFTKKFALFVGPRPQIFRFLAANNLLLYLVTMSNLAIS